MITRFMRNGNYSGGKLLGFGATNKLGRRSMGGDYGHIVTDMIFLTGVGAAVVGGVGTLALYLSCKHVYDNYKIVKKDEPMKNNNEDANNNSENRSSMRPGNRD